MVRGKEISFAPQDIKRVLKLRKDPLPNAASYEERVANKDYRLDHVQEDLCIEGGECVRHKDGRPHYLRRADLEPMTKGWYDFVCRSIMPTTNRSELMVERAVLIHSIIIGENINVEEIIAKQFYKFIYKTDLSSSLPFPNFIGGLTANKKRVRGVLRPSTKGWTEWMTTRQFKEMEAQGIPVTIANLAIYRHREEEMNQERMRYDQILQGAVAQQAREANKGKTRDVVPDSEEEEGSEELHSSAFEEW
ncbi:hypothetical protein PIB30_012776 [Stylosanthes scabra]|uniref:Putative plant transposon protein domain-containing protein n=1 Tax=Stylosanthes scabra TaxID=79078 RepID=A0ABU6S7M7_9FABA|nr:hypothetical protein [Stylosanthes scabra]